MYFSRCFEKSFLPVASKNDDIIVVMERWRGDRKKKNEPEINIESDGQRITQ